MAAPRFRFERVRDAYAQQWAALEGRIGRLGADEWEVPTVVGDWRVCDLVAHLVLVADAVVAAAPSGGAGSAPVSLLGYVSGYPAAAPDIDRRTRDMAADRAPLLDLLAGTGRAALAAVESWRPAGEDPVVAARRGPIRASDFLVTRCIELVVHGDDLARSLSADDVPLLRPALQAAVRGLAGALAERAPGSSVEVRVPPFAAVQCVPGPRHTRGTPPAVVETDPVTFLRLAAGRLGWADAVGAGLVVHSGLRTDLAPYLPLLA